MISILQIKGSLKFCGAEGAPIESDGAGDSDTADSQPTEASDQPGGLPSDRPRSQEQTHKGAAGPGGGVREEALGHGGEAAGPDGQREDQGRGEGSEHRRAQTDHF